MGTNIITNTIDEDVTYPDKNPTCHEEDSQREAEQTGKILKEKQYYPINILFDISHCGMSVKSTYAASLSRLHPGAVSLILCLVVCLFFVPSLVFGGPPFVTDDPETPEWHGFEINNALTLQQTGHDRTMQMPLLDINYGYKPNVQLKVESPYLYANPESQKQPPGLPDTLVGVKWRFYEQDDKLFLLATYPQIALPTAIGNKGLGDGKPSYLLPLVPQKTWGEWTLYGNLGYWIQTAKDTRDFWYGGAVLNRRISEWLELGVELYTNTATNVGDPYDTGFNLGGTLKLSKGYNLLFSTGRSLRYGPDLQCYIALQVVTEGWTDGRRQ
jgi:hypothetical protein